MRTIRDVEIKYAGKLDKLDLDLIVAHVIKKSREFVLAHPEHKIPKFKIENLKLKIARRRRGEPLAYILGHKEFYGLDFKVTKDTLIPRPETELLVEQALQEIQVESIKNKVSSIIDVGTGSGNIIISVAKNTTQEAKFYATDISSKALKIAKQNTRTHKVNSKIRFLHGNLLDPIFGNWSRLGGMEIGNSRMIILANLPYLSKEIYDATLPNVQKYEPKSALYSANEGLAHYEKLLKQIKELMITGHCSLITVLMEISPEQKTKLPKLIKEYLSQAKVEFQKDLTGKWRVCKIKI